MASDFSSRPSLSPLPAIAAELVGFSTCPSCHTIDATVTNVAVNGGADWQCGRCGQTWDAVRLATAAAYGAWLSRRTNPSHHRSMTARGGA